MDWLSRARQWAARQLGRVGLHGQTAMSPQSQPRPATAVLESFLSELSCQFEKDDSSRSSVCYSFTYQGGHFRLPVDKDGYPTARLEFPVIASVESGKLPAVRCACNNFNLSVSISKFVYTYLKQSDEYAVHVFTPILLSDSVPGGIRAFQSILDSMFSLRRQFTELLEYLSQSKDDHDTSAAYVERIDYLVREQEISHLDEDFQLRPVPDKPLTLEVLLERCFGLRKLDYVYLRTLKDEDVSLEFDALVIRDTNVMALAPDAAYFVYFTESKERPSSPLRLAVVTLTDEFEDKAAAYRRVTAVLLPSGLVPEDYALKGRHDAVTRSFLVGIDKVDGVTHRQEYQFVWRDAVDKVQHGRNDSLSEEQRLLLAASLQSTHYDLFVGRRLFQSGRYFEAVAYLLWVYDRMNAAYDSLSPHDRNAFHEVCYLLGFSYMELHDFIHAHFYLSIICDANNYRYVEEYINCLVNSHDFRAADAVTRNLEYVEGFIRKAKENEEEVGDGIMQFYQFLRRRQVHLLIDQNRLARARRILSTMLNEPANADFAIDEMAYLQKLDENNIQPETPADPSPSS